MKPTVEGLLGDLFAISVIIVFWPVARILRRLGLNPWWLGWLIIPPAGFVLLWVLAYAKWPALAELEREKKEKGITVVPRWGK